VSILLPFILVLAPHTLPLHLCCPFAVTWPRVADQCLVALGIARLSVCAFIVEACNFALEAPLRLHRWKGMAMDSPPTPTPSPPSCAGASGKCAQRDVTTLFPLFAQSKGIAGERGQGQTHGSVTRCWSSPPLPLLPLHPLLLHVRTWAIAAAVCSVSASSWAS